MKKSVEQSKVVSPAYEPGSRSRVMHGIAMLFLCLVIAACGFRPLYQDTNTLTGGVSVLNNIWIDTIPNEAGLELRNGLIDRFYHNGTPENPTHHLKITLTERTRDLIIERDSTTTRSQMVVTATYKLVKTATGETAEAGSTRAASSYNVLPSQYTTSVTQSQIRHQILSELADKITLRMAVVMDQK